MHSSFLFFNQKIIFFFQEFVSTEVPSEYRMYKCGLFNCDGEWGTSHEFSLHLADQKHFESFLIEKGILSDKEVSKLSFEQISEKVSEFSDPDFGQMETIRDEERWIIQKSRLATRPIGRIGRKSKNQVRTF